MKKKVKDLTVTQIYEYCKGQEMCKGCCFENGYICTLNTPYDLEEETLEHELEISDEPVGNSDQLEEEE